MNDKKKEIFEEPKVLDLEGKEITEEELEGVAGGAEVGNTCHGGTGGNDCHGGGGAEFEA